MQKINYMATYNITIRNAKKEDARAAARLMLMAFPTDAILSLGKGISYENLENVITRVMELDESIYSYNNILVAETAHSNPSNISMAETQQSSPNNIAAAETELPESNNSLSAKNIVGVLIAYDGARLHQLRKPLEEMLEEYIGKGAHKWEDETSAGEFYLDSLAVEPECRGLNIGSKLIEATIKKAANLGHSKVGLLVDIENPLAEKLYTRLGFEFADYTPFMKHSYKHMQKSLL